MTAPVLSSPGPGTPRRRARTADASVAARRPVGELHGFAEAFRSDVDDEGGEAGEVWHGAFAGTSSPRRTRIEELGDRLQLHLQQAALQSASLATASDIKQKTSNPAVAEQIWEDRANAARGMAMRMSERLWSLSGSKAPQGVQPASFEDALSHCDSALTAAEYAAKLKESGESAALAAIDGRLKRLDAALRAAAAGDTRPVRALTEPKPGGAGGASEPFCASIVACEEAAGAIGKKLAEVLAGLARASEAQHDNQLGLRRVKELEQSVRAANDESVALLRLNTQLEDLISTKLEKDAANSLPAPSASPRASRGILMPPDAGSRRTSARVSFAQDSNDRSPQARSPMANSLNDTGKSMVAQYEPLDGRGDERSDNFADGSCVGSPVKASFHESAAFPSSWVEVDSTSDEDEDGEMEQPRFTVNYSGRMSAFELARESALNEDPPLPSPRKRSSGFDRLGLSPRAGDGASPTRIPTQTPHLPVPILDPMASALQTASPNNAEIRAPQAPPVLKGHLLKKSPSTLRLWSYQKRYIEVRGMLLIWWKSSADAMASGSFSARGGGSPQHAGLIDLRQTPCDIQALGPQQHQTTFTLQPRTGATWQGSVFTGADASRVFVFDACGSEHRRDTWVQVIKLHMLHADALAQSHAST